MTATDSLGGIVLDLARLFQPGKENRRIVKIRLTVAGDLRFSWSQCRVLHQVQGRDGLWLELAATFDHDPAPNPGPGPKEARPVANDLYNGNTQGQNGPMNVDVSVTVTQSSLFDCFYTFLGNAIDAFLSKQNHLRPYSLLITSC